MYVNMRGAIPLVHAAHFVSLARDIVGTFVIILGKYRMILNTEALNKEKTCEATGEHEARGVER